MGKFHREHSLQERVQIIARKATTLMVIIQINRESSYIIYCQLNSGLFIKGKGGDLKLLKYGHEVVVILIFEMKKGNCGIKARKKTKRGGGGLYLYEFNRRACVLIWLLFCSIKSLDSLALTTTLFNKGTRF